MKALAKNVFTVTISLPTFHSMHHYNVATLDFSCHANTFGPNVQWEYIRQQGMGNLFISFFLFLHCYSVSLVKRFNFTFSSSLACLPFSFFSFLSLLVFLIAIKKLSLVLRVITVIALKCCTIRLLTECQQYVRTLCFMYDKYMISITFCFCRFGESLLASHTKVLGVLWNTFKKASIYFISDFCSYFRQKKKFAVK